MVQARVLVAYAEEYRAFREAIAASVGLQCPGAEVRASGPSELGAELERFDPQVVVCGVPGHPDPGRAAAWVDLPAEAGRPARVRVGGERREALDMTLEGLLGIVDEAEAFLRAREGRPGERGTP